MKARRACVSFATATMLLSAGSPVAGQGNPGIAPIGSQIATIRTYAELGAEWWQWALQAPLADSPFEFLAGDKCRVGQRGPVWFLAGTLGSGDLAGDPTTRDCEVPRGKALFFPVINEGYFAFLNDPPEQRTPEFLRGQLQCGNIRELSVMIDGVAVARPERFATSPAESPFFDVQLPTDNLLGATADDIPELRLSPSVHQGYYVYLRPLPPGFHTVEWKASWDCSFGSFSENVRYNLTVTE